jgi:hypothetical protein
MGGWPRICIQQGGSLVSILRGRLTRAKIILFPAGGKCRRIREKSDFSFSLQPLPSDFSVFSFSGFQLFLNLASARFPAHTRPPCHPGCSDVLTSSTVLRRCRKAIIVAHVELAKKETS